MAVAMIYPEPEKLRRKGSSPSLKEELSVSAAHLSRARTVFHDAGALVDSVLAGAMSLTEAYEKAQASEKTASTDDERLADLRARYPELADKVVEENAIVSIENVSPQLTSGNKSRFRSTYKEVNHN